MEHGILYPALLFGTMMAAVVCTYRRHRSVHRMQRGLRSYLARTA